MSKRMITINGKAIEHKKGKTMCLECQRQMHSKFTDQNGNARAVKTIKKPNEIITIYQMICPYSHTRYVCKVRKVN